MPMPRSGKPKRFIARVLPGGAKRGRNARGAPAPGFSLLLLLRGHRAAALALAGVLAGAAVSAGLAAAHPLALVLALALVLGRGRGAAALALAGVLAGAAGV